MRAHPVRDARRYVVGSRSRAHQGGGARWRGGGRAPPASPRAVILPVVSAVTGDRSDGRHARRGTRPAGTPRRDGSRRRPRSGTLGERHAVPHVPATPDRGERGPAVEATVDARSKVTPVRARRRRVVLGAVGADEPPHRLGHSASWKMSPSVWRRPERTALTPWRIGAADQPARRRAPGRSRVVNTTPWPCGIVDAVARDWARGSLLDDDELAAGVVGAGLVEPDRRPAAGRRARRRGRGAARSSRPARSAA